MRNICKDVEFEELADAVKFLKADKVKELFASEWYRRNAISIIHAVCRNLCPTIAMWKICLGKDKTGNPEFEEEWGERFADMRCRANEIIELFDKRFMRLDGSAQISFGDSFKDQSLQSADDWAFRFELPNGISRKKAIAMLSEKYRQIDVELWVAYEMREFGRMKTLLKFGANPFVEIEDTDCVYDRIGWRCTDTMHNALKYMYGDEGYDDEYGIEYWLGEWCECEQLIMLLDEFCSYEMKINLTRTIDRLLINDDDTCCKLPFGDFWQRL